MGLVDTGNVRTRVRIQGWTGPDGCCARVRINLRLLVKIRALSFHLCADWFARLATSNVCVSGPRLRMCWCWDIYMRRCRGRRSGTPVDFLPKEREKERVNPRHFLAFYLFWKRKKEILQHNLYRFYLESWILLTTRVIFLERKTMVWVLTSWITTIPRWCCVRFSSRKGTKGGFSWRYFSFVLSERFFIKLVFRNTFLSDK